MVDARLLGEVGAQRVRRLGRPEHLDIADEDSRGGRDGNVVERATQPGSTQRHHHRARGEEKEYAEDHERRAVHAGKVSPARHV